MRREYNETIKTTSVFFNNGNYPYRLVLEDHVYEDGRHIKMLYAERYINEWEKLPKCWVYDSNFIEDEELCININQRFFLQIPDRIWNELHY